jgi:hypothetical protein
LSAQRHSHHNDPGDRLEPAPRIGERDAPSLWAKVARTAWIQLRIAVLIGDDGACNFECPARSGASDMPSNSAARAADIEIGRTSARLLPQVAPKDDTGLRDHRVRASINLGLSDQETA